MTPLPDTFCRDGFAFRLLKRQGNVALLSKTKPHYTREHYEVVIIQECAEHTWPNGKTTPAHEAMPSNEQFGRYGWAFCTNDRAGAERKFSELISRVTARAA